MKNLKLSTMRISFIRKQIGSSLIIAMIFMIVLALFGVAASHKSIFQEKMAGSTRNRDIAFQAAEHALNDAAETMSAWRTQSFDGSVSGLYIYAETAANDAEYWKKSSNWISYRTPQQALNHVAEAPRYRVAKMPVVGATEYYQVTARGVGADSNAVVVLQAVYKYEP